MKKRFVFRVLIIIACALSVVSCETTTTIKVSSNPGDRISVNGDGYTLGVRKTLPYEGRYLINEDWGGRVPSNGKLKVKMNDDIRRFLCMSSSPRDSVNGANGIMVPFALDYKYRGGYALLWTVGSVLLLPTAGLGGFFWQMAEQSAYKYHYKYLLNQQTNNDLTFTQPNITYLTPPSYKKRQIQDSMSLEKQTDNTSPNNNTKQIGEVSTRKLSDFSTPISGFYSGRGNLVLNGKIIEFYTEINVDVKRIDNNTVSVQIIDEKGEPFFSSLSEYVINRMQNGKATLSNKKFSDATITIDTDYNLSFSHPQVNIDGTIYRLNITAKRK